jgi:hypothetical protein
MTSIAAFAVATLLLAILAALNARQMQKDREAINGTAETYIRYFADVEVRRAWMRSAGWALLFCAMVIRALMAEGTYRTWVVTGTILIGFGVFVWEALEGRRERRRMMRGR